MEHASRCDWKSGVSIVASFFLFGGLGIPLLEKVNPQTQASTWSLVTALFAVAFFGWYYVIRRLPVAIIIVLGASSWVWIALLMRK